MKKNWLYISIFIMVLIFFFSSQNGEQSSHTSGIFTNIILFIFPFLEKSMVSLLIRKGAHFTIFGCLGFSFYKMWEEKKYLLPILCTFLYACSDEFHQSFTAARSCQFSDVLLDTCGAIVFISLFYILKKKRFLSSR